MLRACVIEFKGSWDMHLSLMEFAYNNSYQSSIGMAPFEALYGRKCRTPVCWDEVGERRLIGPELVQITLDKIQSCLRFIMCFMYPCSASTFQIPLMYSEISQ